MHGVARRVHGRPAVVLRRPLVFRESIRRKADQLLSLVLWALVWCFRVLLVVLRYVLMHRLNPQVPPRIRLLRLNLRIKG